MGARKKQSPKQQDTALGRQQPAPLVTAGPWSRHGAFMRFVLLAVLLAATAWAYAPVQDAAFINFDDDDYVYNNPAVRAGLTSQGALWAFNTAHASNYHPLTWISHMMDVALFGLNPGAHHSMNVFLHLLNVALLYALIVSATRRGWAALAVAALWALHPLHVESVAWISERKDVLSALFFLLTLLAWVWYARRPGIWRYLLALLLLALGLLAKPMLVTVPCVLLLVDWWPLGRMQSVRDFKRLLLEKGPFFLLAAGSVLATLWAQGGAGAMASLEELPLGARLANVPVAYATYLWKTLWPAGLGIFYPFVRPPLWLATACLLGLLAVTALLWRVRGRDPWGLMGWLWFLGTLAPVIGIVQVGGQAWADRYSYIPHIGLMWGAVWAASAAASRLQARQAQQLRTAMGLGLALLCGILAWGAQAQARHWQDSETLYRRTLDVTHDNYMIHYNLAVHYRGQGRLAEAIGQYEAALRIAPDYFKALNNLAYLLAAAPDPALREPGRAVELARRALDVTGGGNPALLDTLAIALAAAGRFEEAEATARRAAAIARQAGMEAMAREIASRLPYYRAGRPWRLQ